MGLFDFMGTGKSEAVGVDIGTSSIKAVHLDLRKARPIFKNFAIARLKKGSIQTSNRIIAGKQISKILSFSLNKSQIKCRTASFSVPNFSSFISFVTIPKVTEEQLSSKLEEEARKFIPVPLSEVSLGWEIIKDYNKKRAMEMKSKKDTMKILLMAIANDTIKKYETIAKKSNLNLQSIEAENFSLIRCLIDKENKKKTTLILDIGSRICNILVVYNGFLRGTRNVDVGGGDISNAISRALNIDLLRAEEMKKQGGLQDSRIKDLILPIIGRISQETKRMQETYNSKNPNSPIEQILLVGGTSKLKGFKEVLAKDLNIPIFDGDPWTRVKFDKEQEAILRDHQDELAVAIGVAMNGLD
ncbi:MAG: type IV pilus assembly protein PilM [Candidatus Moranbacteria bacterium]|nr:type IV pilus assembly protein PilM [Candidatus Moranbacteria bacterium]